MLNFGCEFRYWSIFTDTIKCYELCELMKFYQNRGKNHKSHKYGGFEFGSLNLQWSEIDIRIELAQNFTQKKL